MEHSELLDASEHLAYETQMLAETQMLLETGIGRLPYLLADKEAVICYNALLESFLIHARVLIFFFYPPKGSIHDDDVLAKCFFATNTEWQNWESAVLSTRENFLKNMRIEANKRVAHLSTHRGKMVNGYTWTPELRSQLSQYLLILLRSFAENVPRNNLHQKFIDCIGL
ncbi:MAG: hypothetical protein ABI947_28085 [Chloroflexota bacterium]